MSNSLTLQDIAAMMIIFSPVVHLLLRDTIRISNNGVIMGRDSSVMIFLATLIFFSCSSSKQGTIDSGGLCETGKECRLGFCLLTSVGGVCTEECSTVKLCPAGFGCFDFGRGLHACLKYCNNNSDCEGNFVCDQDYTCWQPYPKPVDASVDTEDISSDMPKVGDFSISTPDTK
jgi:hypothetical protein